MNEQRDVWDEILELLVKAQELRDDHRVEVLAHAALEELSEAQLAQVLRGRSSSIRHPPLDRLPAPERSRGGPACGGQHTHIAREQAPPQRKRPPRRVPNKTLRSREYLTPDEVEGLITAAAAAGRHRHRDATLILLAYRHGLRVSELVAVRWDQIDLHQRVAHIGRLKNGTPSNHPLSEREIRALRLLRQHYPRGQFMFVTERGGPLTAATFRKILVRAGRIAELPFPVHPHMLRHACGYKLANEGHDTRAIQHYLGHKNITHTVRYTELSPERFRGFWKD